MKTYYNNNNKYNSKLFDILSTKLLVFYNAYTKLKLHRYNYYYAFFIILKKQAAEFYFNNFFNRNFNFDIIISIAKTCFEINKN